MAVHGQRLFVANAGAASVDEVDLADPSRARVLDGARYHFSQLQSLAMCGQSLWALSRSPLTGEGTLTEIDADSGAVQRTLPGKAYGLGQPTAMTVDGNDLFVADAANNQVSEIDTVSGRLVRLINAPQYVIANPSALATIGPDVFVANDMGGAGGTVTEIDAGTGALVQVIAGVQFDFHVPSALAAYGNDLFVVSSGAKGSLTEVDPGQPSVPAGTAPTTVPAVPPTTTASGPAPSPPPPPAVPPTATVVRVVDGPGLPVMAATVAAVAGDRLYVASQYSNQMAVLDAGTGALVRAEDSRQLGLAYPSSIVYAAGHVYVSNMESSVVDELSPADGALEGTTSGSRYQFQEPNAMTVTGGHLFVLDRQEAPGATPGTYRGAVTEVNGSTGAFVRMIRTTQLMLPTSMVGEDGHLFVADGLDSTLVEVDGSDGRVLRSYPLLESKVTEPTALAASGNDLFVGTFTGELAELDLATGRVVMTTSPTGRKTDYVRALTVDGPDVFVATDNIDGKGSAVTEVSTLDGAVVRSLSGRKFGLEEPSALAVHGDDLFVANSRLLTPVLAEGIDLPFGGSVTEVDVATGQLVRVISGARYAFSEPQSLAVIGDDLFVTDPGDNSVTEVNMATGLPVQVLTGRSFGFIGPYDAAVWRQHLYVSNLLGGTVSDVNLGA